MRFVPGVLLSLSVPALLQAHQTRTIPIESGAGLEAVNVSLAPVTYLGRRAVRLREAHTPNRGIGEAIAVVPRASFDEGTIELDVSGAPGPHARPDDRGFIGIAFHLSPAADRFKTVYLRPTNGRADDQVRRNHVTQFTAEPDWPWDRLRREQPGRYESYVDVVAGEWTPLRLVLSRSRLELYVNRSAQPVLVVTDLKDPATGTGVALWIGSGTEGYFANLRITPKAVEAVGCQ
jgi:hypothetical protein